MGVIKGEGGELRYEGAKVARVKDFSIATTRDVIDITVLGDTSRSFTGSLVSATGNANVLYDNEDPATVELIESFFDGNKSDPIDLTLVVNKQLNKFVNVQAIINSGTITNTVAEVVTASISFQCSGEAGVNL